MEIEIREQSAAAAQAGAAVSDRASPALIDGWPRRSWTRAVGDAYVMLAPRNPLPALQRLERAGWISAKWGASENNRRARFYSLTKAGRRHLEREQAGWERLSGAIALVLRTA
jgi:PadR family transcriptional regulator